MPVQPLPSVTVTVIGNEPPCVGVPERTPFAARLKPVGNGPAVVNVAPPTAPVCVNVALKGAPAAPVVVAGFVTVMVWQAMTSVYVVPVPVQPFASVAVTTIGNEPFALGIPASVPFVASERPAGSELAVVNVMVPMPPVCVNCWLNAAFTVPVVTTGFVTVIVWQAIVSV